MPYSGGYKEQPAWLLEDWRMLGMWQELVKLRQRLPKTRTGMKTMTDMVR